MLFVDKKLQSIYDFGNVATEPSLSVSSLCKEIVRVTDLIVEMVEAGQSVRLCHGDLSTHEKFISAQNIDKSVLNDRDEISLQSILYRKSNKPDDSHTAISTHLKEMGLLEPCPGTASYFKYLQLLYFFYMMKFLVYPGDNIFALLKEKRRSTYFVPDRRAAGGNYWYFILSNLFDDTEAATIYSLHDLSFTARISSLVITLKEKINKDNDMYRNNDAAKKIRDIISQAESICAEEETLGDPVEQMLNIAYQYQMLAYSGDMIKNLDEEKNPFQFGELEFELPSLWQQRHIKVSEIESFMKERDTLIFCFQEEKDYVRPEKSIRGNAFEFVHELIVYDQSLADGGQPRLFTQEEDGDVYIPADWAALIVKTYLDVDENLKMIYRNGSNWKTEQNLQRALSSKTALATDLAMRLFVVAFHSEYLNAHCGYGYYEPLFKCVYLKQYLLLQEAVYVSFSGNCTNTWTLRLRTLQERISNL